MESNPLTFDQLPAYIYQLGRKVDDLTALLRSQNERTLSNPDRWFTIEELSGYLPGKPAIATLYGKVQRREIPFHRRGKRLTFLQVEIDEWLKSNRTATIQEQATQFERQRATRRNRKGGVTA